MRLKARATREPLKKALTPAMRLKAKGVVPSKGGGSGSGKRAVKVGVALAAAAGAVAFWRAQHRDSTDHDSLAAEELDAPLD